MAKILITIEDGLLERLDARVKASGSSRSRFLAELAQREVSTVSAAERRRRTSVMARARLMLSDVEPDGLDAAAWIRQQRDARS